MRISLRIFIVLLCLVQLGSVVFAAAPDPAGGQRPADAQAERVSAASDQDAAQPTEPVTTEPEPEPVPTEPAEPEPEPAEPEPAEPEPEPTEPPVSEMTDEEIIAKYSIRNNWARAGLIFAVRNGILAGKGNNRLCPKDNTSHAELATMLMSLLKTEKQASLDRFNDVRQKDWYAPHMAKAVSLGIFPIANPNAKTLTPNELITREEAYVAIARVFGVHGHGRQSIYRFSDWKEVSDWAAEDLSAMIDAGLLGGSGGKIMPKNRITRQELAVILAGLLTKVSSSLGDEPFTGRMALAADSLPEGATVDGDLLLSTDASSILLKNVTVTGRLIMQGNDTLSLRLSNCSIGELVLCRPTNLYSNQVVPNVTSHKALNLYCHAGSVRVFGQCTLRSGYTVETMSPMKKAAVTVIGTVETMNVVGDKVAISGNGTIKELQQHGAWLDNRCNTNSVTGSVRNTVQDVTGTRTDSSVPSSSSPKVTLKLKLNNLPEGWTECDVSWRLNGKEAFRTSRSLVKEGSVVAQSCDFSKYLDGSANKAALTVFVFFDGGQKQVYAGEIKLDAELAFLARKIRTQDVQGTLTQDVTLYSNMNLTGAVGSYPAGTQVTILQSRHSTYTKVRTADGSVGWVRYGTVRVINGNYYTTEDYLPAVKEYYVNHVRNCYSQTNYLIWVSLYTQRVNIFKGSQGNWKLVQSGQIASGRNNCPTPVEVTTIRYKATQWTYTNYYCHHVSVFDEARGFHSRPTAYSGYVYDSAIGHPASNGCVRLLDPECVFIYDNCPVGTAVYIY